ncbi:MAG: hypothetical protein MSC48_08900 [Spirochaetia bacterium]|nr:hypothetical protein [Spirochaetia bacterium]
MSDKVPNLPNYENFMKATNKSTVFILAFMNFLMEMNRKKNLKYITLILHQKQSA